jgi:hypothetical protein
MNKKILVLLAVMIVFVGFISAEEVLEEYTPSKFDVGVIMNYSYADLQQQNFKAYVPALRFQLNVKPWLGFSVTGYSRGQEYFSLVAEVVLRAPLGIIEPYFATGPGYLLAFTDDASESGTSNFAYNFRAGFDINITDWFSVGPGITLLIPDVNDFFSNISTLDKQYLEDTCLIGVGAKLRF